jgi:pSer/pThr/pTyr-binding forkhead associated (FHA) protein
MAKLTVLEGNEQRTYELGAYVSIGRHEDNIIQILDRLLGKEHAVIERRGDGYVLRDLGSLNGTFVRDERVTEHKLEPGDVVQMGATRLMFEDDPPAANIDDVPIAHSPARGDGAFDRLTRVLQARLLSLADGVGSLAAQVRALARRLDDPDFDVATLRLLAEGIVAELATNDSGGPLERQIERLVERSVVNAVTASHLHLLRVIGNTRLHFRRAGSAHGKSGAGARTIAESDILAGLCSVTAVIEWFSGREVLSGARAYAIEWNDRRWPLRAEQVYIVGRDPSPVSDIQIDHPQVSRQHCQLDLTAGVLVVKDLGSKHGTMLAGRRITEERIPPLHDVELRLGGECAVHIRVLRPISFATEPTV